MLLESASARVTRPPRRRAVGGNHGGQLTTKKLVEVERLHHRRDGTNCLRQARRLEVSCWAPGRSPGDAMGAGLVGGNRALPTTLRHVLPMARRGTCSGRCVCMGGQGPLFQLLE